MNWEGRGGSFAEALPVPGVRSDLYVLGAIADEMDVHLGLPDAAAGARGTRGARHLARRQAGAAPPGRARGQPGGGSSRPGQALLATWRQLLDSGRMQDGEPSLAGTARPVVARMSAATAAEAGVADGDKVTIATDRGSVTVPVDVVPMADRVVWHARHRAARCNAPHPRGTRRGARQHRHAEEAGMTQQPVLQHALAAPGSNSRRWPTSTRRSGGWCC